jgi:ABC-type uncharacterized transport system auxiliary subunit
MMARKIVTAITFGSTLLAMGCAGSFRGPRYYSLSIAPELKTDSGANPRPVTIGVRDFEAPFYLRQGKIVYREHPEQVGFYAYHRWASDPGAQVTTAVVDSLRSSHSVSFVEPYESHRRADYLLSGRLERLEELDYGSEVTVEAKVSAELVNSRTGAVVWAGDASKTAKVERKDVNSVVTDMSHALSDSINQLLSEMVQKLPSSEVSSR